MYARFARHPVVLAGIFASYFGLGKLGFAIGGWTTGAVAVWPASGLALASMVLFGPNVWPAVFAGAAVAYLSATGQFATSLMLAIGYVLESLIGAALVDRTAEGVDVFRSARTSFRFAAIAAAVAAPIGAAAAAGAVFMAGGVTTPELPYLMMRFWLASLTGMLVVTPFLLLFVTSRRPRVRWLEALEAVVLFALLVFAGLVVFGGRFPSDVKTYPLEFVLVPFLLWAAFRFGRREMAILMVVLSAIVIWGTLRNYGPFARPTWEESMILVQAYICVMAITGIVLAAVVAEHKHAEIQLREMASTDPLTGLVNYRRLLDVLRTEIARSSRTHRPFTIVFVDMNGLKKVNDKYGHLVGSRALCRIADALRRSCRALDTPARFGGDEFAVVLPETLEEGAQVVLQRIYDRLAADLDKPALSVSGGLAVFPRDGDTPTLLLRAADKALYEAKARSKKGTPSPEKEEELKTGTLF